MSNQKRHIPNDVREANYWIKRMGYADTYKIQSLKDPYYRHRYRIINLKTGKILADTPEFGFILEQLIVDEHIPTDW